MSSYQSLYEEIDLHLSSTLKEQTLPSNEERKKLLERSVLSASGLRFCCSGDDQDLNPWPNLEVQSFVLCAASCLFEKLEGQEIWIGCDTRPTGRFLMTLLYRYYKAKDLCVRVMGHGPIPQIMAATHLNQAAGFCYLTASHNPAGHNGLKMGLSDGAVLASTEAKQLIEKLKERLLDDSYIKSLWEEIHWCQGSAAPEITKHIDEDAPQAKKQYTEFALNTAAHGKGQAILESLTANLKNQQMRFVFDMNGSSRLLGPDIELLESMGVHVEVFGKEPGAFNHAIVPEGESLKPAAERLQALIDAGENVLGALVPDCDGDRGNLVLPIEGKARVLSAQETFCLCVLAEILSRRTAGETAELAVAVNGPTSLRLNELLKPFNVKVIKAEVGEANVLAKAEESRQQGIPVPICGEGSNGGNITHPSTVRDPLLTLLSLIQFLHYKLPEQQKSIAEIFVEKCASEDGELLQKILSVFPHWTTTDAYEAEALMPVPKIDHDVLKSRYEEKLQAHFEQEKEFWQSHGVAKLKWISFEGTKNIPGPGNRPAPAKGGLSAFLLNNQDEEIGYLWMRGSGTEPVFRVVVDYKGDRSHHDSLLALHRKLIEEAAKA